MKRVMLSLMMIAATASAQPIVFEELSPALYLRNRNAKPQLARAMEQAGVEVAMAILANPQRVQYAHDGEYPVAMRKHIKGLRNQESIAVLQAALMVVAQRAPPAAAVDAMMPYVTNGPVRSVAAERLGEVQDLRVVPTLAALLDDKDSSLARAARAGLGHQRNGPATATLLAAWLQEPTSLHSSTLLALAHATSPSAHQAMRTEALGKSLAVQVCSVVGEDEPMRSTDDAVILRALHQRCH
jgi:hypothetical protein